MHSGLDCCLFVAFILCVYARMCTAALVGHTGYLLVLVSLTMCVCVCVCVSVCLFVLSGSRQVGFLPRHVHACALPRFLLSSAVQQTTLMFLHVLTGTFTPRLTVITVIALLAGSNLLLYIAHVEIILMYRCPATQGL